MPFQFLDCMSHVRHAFSGFISVEALVIRHWRQPVLTSDDDLTVSVHAMYRNSRVGFVFLCRDEISSFCILHEMFKRPADIGQRQLFVFFASVRKNLCELFFLCPGETSSVVGFMLASMGHLALHLVT
mmetsp:Transcript_48576/g.128808  ORF Transcript_48576/g.128808 Transcript_48576/m.128808 type:complete len:128 (-) Transcript_48576:38-421(-)